jgi:hypothetical protein
MEYGIYLKSTKNYVLPIRRAIVVEFNTAEEAIAEAVRMQAEIIDAHKRNGLEMPTSFIGLGVCKLHPTHEHTDIQF